MKPVFRPATFCAVALLVATALIADEEPVAKKGKKQKKAPMAAVYKLPMGVELSGEQQAKLDELKTQYATRLADARTKVTEVYTADQKASREAAAKEAKAAGKKGKELKSAADAAVTLSDEQKDKLATAQSELKSLRKEIRKGIAGLLTTDQRQLLKGKGKPKKQA